MKNRIVTIAIAGLSVAALIGGITITATGRSGSAQSAGAVSPRSTTTLASPGVSAPAPISTPATTATVRTAMARVGGVVEAILVNDKGLPLYTYKPDTATQSMVTGELAAAVATVGRQCANGKWHQWISRGGAHRKWSTSDLQRAFSLHLR